jgi:hypothetical protein
VKYQLFTETASTRRHFPSPQTEWDLLEDDYDPTYGQSSPTIRRFVSCFTCAAIVPVGYEQSHADWHESIDGSLA